jgi:hypothetical protein
MTQKIISRFSLFLRLEMQTNAMQRRDALLGNVTEQMWKTIKEGKNYYPINHRIDWSV